MFYVGSYLTVLAASGDGLRALKLWDSHRAFITAKGASSLLTALAHCAMVSEMQRLWQDLSQRITLSIVHYNCLLDGLSRAGRLDECVAQLKKLEKRGKKNERYRTIHLCVAVHKFSAAHIRVSTTTPHVGGGIGGVEIFRGWVVEIFCGRVRCSLWVCIGHPTFKVVFEWFTDV